MRLAFSSVEAASGLSDRPAPVAGSMRMTLPLSRVGPSVRRVLCERKAPPSAVGGVCAAPTATGGSPNGLSGLPSCP